MRPCTNDIICSVIADRLKKWGMSRKDIVSIEGVERFMVKGHQWGETKRTCARDAKEVAQARARNMSKEGGPTTTVQTKKSRD